MAEGGGEYKEGQRNLLTTDKEIKRTDNNMVELQ